MLSTTFPRFFQQFPAPNQSDMSYSFFDLKPSFCNSQPTTWQAELTMGMACTLMDCLDRQQPGWPSAGITYFCSMKNPRKSPNNTVGTVGRGLKKVQQDLSDLPLFIQADQQPAPQEKISPEEESFRSLLHHKLSRHKAPSALKERIMNKIKSMPD